MKNQKGFIPVIIILLVLIGFGAFYFLSTLKPKTGISTPSPISPPKSIDTDNNKKVSCVNEGYDWIDEFNECESPILAPEFCSKQGGSLNECESPCRHSVQEFCSDVCIVVCKFK